MLYLFLAILSSAAVSICMRISEKSVHSSMVMFTANYAVCCIISLLHMNGVPSLNAEPGMGWSAILGIISGALYLASFVLLQRNIRLNGVILSSAAMKLGGVLIPVLVAVILFHDKMGWFKLLGVTIAMAAVLLLNIEKGSAGQGTQKQWLLILLLGSGLTDTMANIYDKTGSSLFKDHYLGFTFLAAVVITLVSAIIRREKMTIPAILWGLIIGIPNYYSARFLLLALGHVAAVVAYPVFSVGTIVLVTLIGVLAFREKLSRQKQYALLSILAALILLNL